MRVRTTLTVCSLAITLACGTEYDAVETAHPHGETSEELYGLNSAYWSVTGLNHIPVCWEDAGWSIEKEWVRDQISRTWNAVNAMQFVGWGRCASWSWGVRIKVADQQPHVRALGIRLSGRRNGMSLNFSYFAYGSVCRTQREHCIRATAVHEFGHALGFSHEQNRPDTPASCTDAPQGTDGNRLLTPWDIHSVMNYCNPSWNNGGELSAYDIQGVQAVYGAPGAGDDEEERPRPPGGGCQTRACR